MNGDVRRMNSIKRKHGQTQTQGLEKEWVALIKTARNLGISPDEVREFFKGMRESKIEREKV